MWDEVTDTLCNLDFIQAKACAKLTYDLVKDFHFALNRFPEYQPEKEKEHERQEITDKYIRDLIDHAEGKITIQEKWKYPQVVLHGHKKKLMPK